jgi:hypothetical protein
MLAPGRARTVWRAFGVFAALLSIAWLPWHVGMLSDMHRRLASDGTLYGDLRDAGQAAPVRAAFARCRPLTAGDHRPVPYIRWWLDGPPGSVGTLERDADGVGRMLLLPRRVRTTRRIYPPEIFPRTRPPAGWTGIYVNRSWRVYAAPGC